jgi:hypothetical protein
VLIYWPGFLVSFTNNWNPLLPQNRENVCRCHLRK